MRFAYWLADRHGILDVDGMLEQITYDQFQNWVAFSHIEPAGEERADLRSAIVASTIANCNTRRGGKRFTPKDFMPDFSHRPRKRMTGAEICAVMNAAVANTARARKNGKN